MHLSSYPKHAMHRAKRWLDSHRGAEWANARHNASKLKEKTPERHRADKLAVRLGPPAHIMQTLDRFGLM